MKNGPIHRRTMVKNRELMVYDTIVRGKMLTAKVNVDWIKMPKMYWKWQNHLIGATTPCKDEKPVSKAKRNMVLVEWIFKL